MDYDHIVVGAGIEGAATAYYLAKQGHRTLMLDQFPTPHTRGSSHGLSRQIRSLYSDDIYLRMIEYCYRGWRQLEKDSKQTLLIQTESLMIGHKDHDYVREIAETAKRLGDGTDLEAIEKDSDLARRYPNLVIEKDFIGIRDKKGGILVANKCLQAYINLFFKYGGTLKDHTTVTNVSASVNSVTVFTKQNAYRARSVVLCLGPWAGAFMKQNLGLNLPLKPTRATCYYCQVTKPGTHSGTHGAPTVNYVMPNGDFYFSWSSYEFDDKIKVGLHLSNLESIDPEARDIDDMTFHKEKVLKFFGEHWKHLDPTVKLIEECIYTWTPDGNFILDKHPKHPNIVIGAGFSGHGFKFAPVVGKMLGELAVGDPDPDFELDIFSINRFPNTESKL